MTNNDHDTPEIEPWEMKEPRLHPAEAATDESKLKEIVRNSFREPILAEDPVSAEIDGQKFQVIDIGSFGIGISVPRQDSLAQGAGCNIILHIGDNTLNIQGEVCHTSAPEGATPCHCGIKFTDMTQDNEQKLQQFLLDHHSRIFAQNNDQD